MNKSNKTRVELNFYSSTQNILAMQKKYFIQKKLFRHLKNNSNKNKSIKVIL